MIALLVRHAEPRYDEVDTRGYFGMGHEFGRLTEQGIKQAELRAYDERFVGADLIVSSPYTRALQTAAVISRMTQIPLVVENDIHEWMPDVTQKFEVDDYSALYHEYINQKGIRTDETKYPWESYMHLKKRVDQVLNKYKTYRKIIIVSHGIAISTQTFFEDTLEYCGVREIEL